jgi:hypothetical protein
MNLKFLSWHEGKYSDLWFFVHFLSGMTGGTLLLLAGVPEPAAWVTAFTLAIIWEIIEWKNGIKETAQNRVLDIFVGVAGGAVGYLYINNLAFSPHVEAAILTIEMLVLATVSAVGWKNYKNQDVRA